jgi:signal transduction histidine kinase
MALPIMAMVLLGVVYLRDEAMRFDATDIKIRSMCAWVALDVSSIPAERRELERLRWDSRTRRCDGGTTIASERVRVGDVVVEGVEDHDKVVECAARYESTAVVPNLSLWPFTDPDSIGYTALSDNGEVHQVYPLQQAPRPAPEARPSSPQAAFNRQTLSLLATGLFLLAALTAAVWWATGRVLRPVEAIRREVADITEHDLARRVPVPSARNEITRLATTVNATLDRLQTAVDENRRFVADASHELRSPIAALRAELEIAHTYPDLSDWRAVVDGALQDTYRLQQLATDLLLLARLDHAPTATAGAEIVDLAAVVLDETSRRRTRSGITIAVELDDRPAVVQGSRALLARLLGNLLDNAERHADDHIMVRLTTTGTAALLDVIDDGPGIPPEDRERIFERFTRLDHARTRDLGGTGLGLPIARRIATHHHGTLHVTDHAHGTRFTATIPLAADDTTDDDGRHPIHGPAAGPP